MSGTITAAVVGVAAVGTSIYEGAANRSQQSSIAGQQLGLANQIEGKQNYYNQQLMNLQNDPSSFLNNSLFQSSLNQGLTGVSRQMAAQGYLGSGNQATALENYGQSQAWSSLFQQENLLAGLSGATQNPEGALSGAANTTQQNFNDMGQILASLGYAGRGVGGAVGGLGSGGGGGFGGTYYSTGAGNGYSLIDSGSFDGALGDLTAANGSLYGY